MYPLRKFYPALCAEEKAVQYLELRSNNQEPPEQIPITEFFMNLRVQMRSLLLSYHTGTTEPDTFSTVVTAAVQLTVCLNLPTNQKSKGIRIIKSQMVLYLWYILARL